MKQKLLGAAAGMVLALVFTTCGLEVNDPVREIPIIEPYISVQPQSYSYTTRTGSGNINFTTPPELSVEVSDWQRLDGTLQYQWYTFETIEEYCAEPVGGTPIPGATESTYTPTNIVNQAGNTYYYYVVVTNDFPFGIDRQSASIQSELSVISITERVFAPVLTKQPVSAAYPLGRSAAVAPLEVLAISPGAAGTATVGTVSYQWYINDTFSTVGGTEIVGANLSKYLPDISTMSRGRTYYYVEISNTQEVPSGQTTIATSTTITCLPVYIEMLAAERAQVPRITAQPKDQLVFAGGAIAPLSVTAISGDGGTITYQWYSADKPAETAEPTLEVGKGVTGFTKHPIVPTLLPGETSATYTPSAASGYYFVEVTNTNNDVEDETHKSEMVRSKVVTVSSGAAAGSITPNATITIPDNYNVPGSPSRQQYIRGYGGMDVAWNNFPNTTKEETELQYNQDWGLGYNILRIMIMPPGTSDPNYTTHKWIIDRLTGDDPEGSGDCPDFVNNVKVVNATGGFVLASPWTPPKEWKTNNSINSGGHLITSYYRSFANYLRDFAQEMYYRGAPIYAISIANEPNYAGGYDGCEWEPDQMRDFWKLAGHFTDGIRGWGGGKSLPAVLTMNGESANNPNINFSALNDPVSRAAMDIFARHVYGSQLNILWGDPVPGNVNVGNPYASWKEGSPYQTECWMTEHNINSASPTAFPLDSTWNYIWRFMNDIDLVIRRNNENGFVWWASKRFYSMIGDGQYTTIEGAVLPRGYGLSHYAKYSNNTTRIAVDISGTTAAGAEIKTGNTAGANVNATPGTFSLDSLDAKITAFVSPDGSEISFVMYTPTNTGGGNGVNMGDIKIEMPAGFKIGSVKAHRSKGDTSPGGPMTARMELDDTVVIDSNRTAAYVNLPMSQILSVKFIKQQE